jgi:outer membrane lipoprotein-sorting protein
MRTFTRTPLLRWVAPVVTAVVLLGGGWAAAELTASAQETLPARTAQQLLVDVQQANLDGLSGTVEQKADLGIPALPGGSGSSDLTSLLSGTHTLKVWLSSPDKARVALLGSLGESDVVVNGRDLWTWSSRSQTATHRTIEAPSGSPSSGPDTGTTPTTPQQLAQELLKRLDPTTRVTSDGTTTVAGREAYQLTLAPRDTRSLVGEVRIAIDGATHVPLRVQVFPRGENTAAFEIGFTQFDPTRPDASRFDFTPPPGATVTEKPPLTKPQHQSGTTAPDNTDHGQVVGTGWTAVHVDQAPTGALPDQLRQVVDALPKVSGSWGSGRLLSGSLFSAVLTDDGRVAVGAVPPELLYQALGSTGTGQ